MARAWLWAPVYGAVALAAGCSAASSDSQTGAGGGAAASGGGGGAGNAAGAGAAINTGGSANGGGGGVSGECAGVTQEANNTVKPADVIWTIDTSCSMVEETAAVRQNMNDFSKQISAAGVDIRIVLIAEQWEPSPVPGLIPDDGICIDGPLGSGQCPQDSNLPKFAHIFQTVTSSNSLQLILQTYPTWKDVLRPNSLKIFTVVTDDNSAITAADFTSQVNTLDPVVIQPNSWKVYGIYSFTDCPSAATPGSVYASLVQQTGGVAGDLCLQNLKPVFDQLALGIVSAAKLDCGWLIPPPPAGETFNKDKVNVVFTPSAGTPTTIGKVGSKADCGAQGGWYYDDGQNPTAVLLCESTCQTIQSDDQGRIDIKFGCDTVLVPS
jgi:hypothetical protein